MASTSITESELLRDDDDRFFRSLMYIHIALNRLATGDRTGAKGYFQKMDALHMYGDFPWEMARTFLIRMDQDPNWPPWIPTKE